MKLSQLKDQLKSVDLLVFQLENGDLVPDHFHVTEFGLITKDFIDCGGTSRSEHTVSFQLWVADDYDHRLSPDKFLSIIEMAERNLVMGDFEIEVQYQSSTIGIWGLDFEKGVFCLTSKKTDCLAKDKCGITVPQKCSGETGCC